MNDDVRNTRKSRLVNEMSETLWELVMNGNRSPSKSEIVDAVVSNSVTDGASSAIKALLEDETANMLERYFADVCKAAAHALDNSPYHLVSKAFYKKGSRPPRDMEEVTSFVVCFGNGRQSRAAGVRFPCSEDEPDALLLYVTQKDMDVTQKALATHEARIKTRIDSPALPQEKRAELNERLGVKRVGNS